jgi:tripartite-type tricarboxylate transporter receptor subunit TctC
MSVRICVLRVCFGLLLFGGAAVPSEAADSGTEFYRGKTVSYIVATAPGGGHDFYGRMVARHMERFLPGSTFVVKNVPGAGHLIGANTIYGSKPDGLTIGTFSTGLTVSQIVGKEGVRFDLTKMSWIGKGATDTRVLLIAEKSGLKSFEDVKNAKREIKLATGGVGAGDYNETLILSRAFNLPFKPMLGYGGGERSMAMMRGASCSPSATTSRTRPMGATSRKTRSSARSSPCSRARAPSIAYAPDRPTFRPTASPPCAAHSSPHTTVWNSRKRRANARSGLSAARKSPP